MTGKLRAGRSLTVRRVTCAVRLWAAVALALPAAVFAVALAPPAHALGNGLALTPPMGWNDWNAYGCNVSEQLVKQTALAMHDDGMQAAGYSYVNIDDCWMSSSRDADGDLAANPSKFPDGIAAVASYVHSLGLKLGIYEDAGTATCAGYPGSYGHEQQDANQFASWGVDYLKEDWCNIPFGSFSGQSHQQVAQTLYTRMKNALAATGRPIVFSMCNGWDSSVQPWTWASPVANLWRTTSDIQPNFTSMLNNFHINVALASFAGPGAWNDPDMLEVGNGMTALEDQSEFSLWAEMAAPLIEGSNLLSASAATLSILTSKAVIAVDQDSLGRQGTEVSSSGGLDVLAKPLANGDVSVALFNESGSAATISTTAAAIGKTGASSYTLTNLWTGATSTTAGPISASVPSHGTVMFRVAGSGTSTNPSGEIHAAGAGKCLDVPHLSTTPGTQLDIWTCNGGSNQIWTRTSSGQLTVYSGSSQMCMDAYDNQATPGTKVEIWACNGGANQQWQLNANGTITGVQSGLCLDVTGGSTADGALAELWTCNGQSNQQWTPQLDQGPSMMGKAGSTMTFRSRLRRAAKALLVLGAGMALAGGATVAGSSLPARAATQGPCDIYSAGGTPCVAAHSTTRALYAAYSGPLYQVRRASDNATTSISPLSAGGVANAATQNSFCAGTTCVITEIYDQSGNGNNLTDAPGGGAAGGPDGLANATAAPVTVGGHQAYGVYIAAGDGYRDDSTRNIATGNNPESEYAIFDGTHYNGGCCFDYGNAETNNDDDGAGTMEAIYFGNIKVWGYGTGNGPWIMADMENGLYSGSNAGYNANDPTTSYRFTTAMIEGGANQWAILGGNAQSGSLATDFSGVRPPGYNPMKKQGAIILGTGGDNSKGSDGTFYEGVMTTGYASASTEAAVQANIVAAGYATSSGGGGTTGPIVAGDNKSVCVDDNNGSTANGSKIQMWTCDGYAPAQNWTLNSNGSISINGTSSCIDITGANYNNGTPIQLYSCWGGANQQWQVEGGQLVNPASGKCLDDPGFNTANGTQLDLWTCNGGSNQQWAVP